jgi:hypothetical protein
MQYKTILFLGAHLDPLSDMAETFGIDHFSTDGSGSPGGIFIAKDIDSKVAFIHLSCGSQQHGKATEFNKTAIEMLPEHTRRILICNGIDYPAQAKTIAIELKADMLIDADKLYERSWEAHKDGVKTPFHIIIERGYTTSNEIDERGITIELDGGTREGFSIYPERNRGNQIHDYSDDYFRRK